MEETVRIGDDGLVESLMIQKEQLVAYIDKFLDDHYGEKEKPIPKGNIYPEGSMQERFYAYAARYFRKLTEEEIFMGENDLINLIEIELVELDFSALGKLVQAHWMTWRNVTEKAFNDIVLERRKNSKQTELFKE